MRFGRIGRSELILLSCSIVLSYLCLEVAYRFYEYYSVMTTVKSLVAAQVPTNSTNAISVFDPYTGYRYAPNYVGERGTPWFSHWHTNSYGQVSSEEYPVEKPKNEFRIAVLGDSFTADITNNIRWTELLEQKLNASELWRQHVGGRFTRVINFGVDGFGIVQMAAMAEHYASQFEPDIILTDLILDDILRKMHYVAVLPPDSRVSREQYVALLSEGYVKTVAAARWLSLRPDLLLDTVVKLLGNSVCPFPHDRLGLCVAFANHELDSTKARVIDQLGSNQKFLARSDAVRASAAAFETIASLPARSVFLVQPLFDELEHNPMPQWDGLLDEVNKAGAGIHFVKMLPYMQTYLDGKPTPRDPRYHGIGLLDIMKLPEEEHPEIYTWFFLPVDQHYTDKAVALYAQAVYAYFTGEFLSKK